MTRAECVEAFAQYEKLQRHAKMILLATSEYKGCKLNDINIEEMVLYRNKVKLFIQLDHGMYHVAQMSLDTFCLKPSAAAKILEKGMKGQ